MSIPQRHSDEPDDDSPAPFKLEPVTEPHTKYLRDDYDPKEFIAVLRQFREEPSEDPEADWAEFLEFARAIDEDRLPGSRLFKKYLAYRHTTAQSQPTATAPAVSKLQEATRSSSDADIRWMTASDRAAAIALLKSWRNEEDDREGSEVSLASLNEFLAAIGEDPIEDPRVPPRR